MIIVISATNRPHSNSLKVAKKYTQLLDKKNVMCKMFSFEELPKEFLFSDLFGKRSETFQQLLEKYIIPAQKMVIIAPEYNGSYPGILKSFFDAIHPDMNRGKKVALVGVATGRAGNIRGMEDLTGVLNYLGMYVLPNKLPISGFLRLVDENGDITDEATVGAIEKQAMQIISW